jgi:hypothetical protein
METRISPRRLRLAEPAGGSLEDARLTFCPLRFQPAALPGGGLLERLQVVLVQEAADAFKGLASFGGLQKFFLEFLAALEIGRAHV